MTARAPVDEALVGVNGLVIEKLDPLSPGDAAALARNLLGEKSLSTFELTQIVDHADGVPLFIEEFARGIVDKQVRPDSIPITLRDSLMGTLDSLGTGRAVALCASVFGRRFSYVQLRELLDLDDGELAPAVEVLTKAQILVQVGEMPNAAFEFRHPLLRETAYHTLLKSERQRWRHRVAQLAATGSLPIKDSIFELLATHHSVGGSYKSAIDYWLQAHGEAMQRGAVAEALAHIRSGLEDCRQLAMYQPAEAARLELDLLRKLSTPLIALAGWSSPELEGIYARALKLCATTSSEDVEFELQRGLYNLHLLRGELRIADDIADRLLAAAQEISDTDRRETLLLFALRSKALPAFYSASYCEARSLLEQMLSFYDPKKHAGHAHRYGTEPAVVAQSYLAWMDVIDGQTVVAKQRLSCALMRARAEGHIFSICYALCFAASCAQLSGDPADAELFAEEASSLGNQYNFQYWLTWAKAIQGWVTGLDRPQQGIALINEARAGYLATGSSLVTPYFDALACIIGRSIGLDGSSSQEAALTARARQTGIWFWRAALKARPLTPP
jgi:hypothetical protein